MVDRGNVTVWGPVDVVVVVIEKWQSGSFNSQWPMYLL